MKQNANKSRDTIPLRPLLHTYAVEAIMEGNTICGVITESKSGRRAILAQVVKPVLRIRI